MKDNKLHEWYFVSVLLGFFPETEISQSERPSFIIENTFLVKAPSISGAYDKSVEIGRNQECKCVENNICGAWRFLGIKQLVQIYEDIEDGAEILSRILTGEDILRNTQMIKSKSEWIKFHRIQDVAK